MHKTPTENFYIIGISFRKTEVSIRSLFSINENQYANILKKASIYSLKELMIISTCNRTEVIGFAQSPEQIINLVCNVIHGVKKEFVKHAYVKRNEEAVKHFFNLAVGLDSQILGDYEIIGQIKKAAKFARTFGFLGAFTERLISDSIYSSKKVKNQTTLSSGTTSVSYAVVQFLQRHVKSLSNKKLMIVGAGKIGKNTCQHLCKYTNATNITLVNRSKEKADSIANELNIRSLSLSELPNVAEKQDVIILAVSSYRDILLKEYFLLNNEKLIIDLSVPSVVESSLKDDKLINFVNVDQLSKVKDDTLAQRKAEVPKAKKIIKKEVENFFEWNERRKYVPYLKTVKKTLLNVNLNKEGKNIGAKRSKISKTEKFRIQQVVNHLAKNIPNDPFYGCNCIEAINEYLYTDR